MILGETIKKRREQLGLTQQDLAEKLFVSRQTVCRWENGTRCPDLIMAKKIAIVLGVSLDELTPGEIVQDYVPPREPITDISGVKVMLIGVMLLLISIFFYVADGTGIYIWIFPGSALLQELLYSLWGFASRGKKVKLLLMTVYLKKLARNAVNNTILTTHIVHIAITIIVHKERPAQLGRPFIIIHIFGRSCTGHRCI